MSSSQSYQADCFTPKKALHRSPPPCAAYSQAINQENKNPIDTQDKGHSQDAFTQAPVTSNEHDLSMSGSALREVQDSCFKPSRSLKRSPQVSQTPNVSPSNFSSEQQDSTDRDVVNMAPPPRQWEIPRTPVQTRPPCTPVQYQQYQVQSPSDRISNKSTPRRVKTPTHPLSRSTRAISQTPRKRLIRSTSTPEPSPVKGSATTDTIVSPPITTDNGLSQLTGLQCTANDLAYLQHMKTVKLVSELKAQAEELTRAQKKKQEEKEQLEHEAKKIDGDVATIKSKVQSITATVHELVCEESGVTVGELQKSQVDHLKRLNQKSAAELERAERERKAKLAQINETTQKLTKEIKTLELKQNDEKSSLEGDLASTQDELSSLQTKKQELHTQHQNAKDELELLQAEMAGVSLSEEGESSREQLEQGLRTLVRRCDLYVKRHNILKEMGL